MGNQMTTEETAMVMMAQHTTFVLAAEDKPRRCRNATNLFKAFQSRIGQPGFPTGPKVEQISTELRNAMQDACVTAPKWTDE